MHNVCCSVSIQDAAMLNTGAFLRRSTWSRDFLRRVWGTQASPVPGRRGGFWWKNWGNNMKNMDLYTHRIHGAGIYANIWGRLMVNVHIYGIHGSYGIWALYDVFICNCPNYWDYIWRFPKMGEISNSWMVYDGNSIYKWMRTGGTPMT